MSVVPWSCDLRVLAQRFGELSAVVDGDGRVIRYRELAARAHALGAWLMRAGFQPGDPVGVLLPNCVQAVWTSYGVRLSGAAEVSLNWGYTADEIAWSAGLVPFTRVLTDARRAEQIRALGLEPVLVDEIEPEADHWHPVGRTRTGDDGGPVFLSALAPVPAQARSRILFTSGTTGRPKAVVYEHGARWAGEQLLRASMPFIPQAGDRLVLMTPFPHGASLLTYAWCSWGGEVQLFDGVMLDRIEPLLSAGEVDALFAPPTVLAKLAAAFGDRRFDGVRCVFTGTQALPASLYEKARAMFGPVVRITYGKTECVNPITVLEPDAVDTYLSGAQIPAGACVGWPAPGVEIKIVAAQDDEASPVPQDPAEPTGPADAQPLSGEVWLRARHMSSGLIDQDGFHVHGPDGWHRTGDLGYLDRAGRLVLTGREADVIKTGGYRVNPDEIEMQMQAMARCGPVCVTSLPSEYWGEVIIAVAEQARDGWADEARERVASLSQHKRPRLFLEVDALPRNPQGKVNRRQVARLVLQSHALVDGPYPDLQKLDSMRSSNTANRTA